MIRLRAGKRHGAGSTPGSYSETTRPALADPTRELGVRRRVVAVDSAPEDGDGRPPASSAPRCASPSMPRAIPLTTTSPAAASSRASERATERPYDEHARAPTTATARLERSSSLPRPRRKSCGGGSWIAASRLGYAGSRRRMQRISVSRDSSPGIRYESASATCAGSTSSAPASAAMVRATRATRTRPRPESGSRSTALDRSSEAASVRRGSADRRRSRAVDDALANGCRGLGRRSGELGRARSRHRRPRGRSGRAAPARASPGTRRAAAACRRTRPPDRRARRTGTCSSCRRAGSEPGRARARRRARPRRRRPRAAGGATSRTERGNSGSSSSSRTPRCASETSPGRGPGPPPTMAGADAP